jgi:hypothetical protein
VSKQSRCCACVPRLCNLDARQCSVACADSLCLHRTSRPCLKAADGKQPAPRRRGAASALRPSHRTAARTAPRSRSLARRSAKLRAASQRHTAPRCSSPFRSSLLVFVLRDSRLELVLAAAAHRAHGVAPHAQTEGAQRASENSVARANSGAHGCLMFVALSPGRERRVTSVEGEDRRNSVSAFIDRSSGAELANEPCTYVSRAHRAHMRTYNIERARVCAYLCCVILQVWVMS